KFRLYLVRNFIIKFPNLSPIPSLKSGMREYAVDAMTKSVPPSNRFVQMKASSSRPWLLLLHVNTTLSSIFAASPSRIEEEALAVKPTLSLEWQEDEIYKYLSEPLSFPQPTLPLGYSKPVFHTLSNSHTQELQHQPAPDSLAFEVDHTPTTLFSSNGVLTSNPALSLEDPTSKGDRTAWDLTWRSGSASIADLAFVGGLTPDAQLTPDHNLFPRKRKGDESISKANSHLALARKQTKDKKKKVLHADPTEELPNPTQSNQSKGRKARVDPTNIRLLLVDTLLSSSNVKIQIENYDLFNEMMHTRIAEVQQWKGTKDGTANDVRARVRVLKFWKNVTKMSTFLIISHASLLNGNKDKEITQADVKDVLEFMKDFWAKMDRHETLVTSRLYTSIPKIPNLLDPNDIDTHKEGGKGKILWYEACKEIAEYWTERNTNPLWESSSNTNSQCDKFNIRQTFNFIIAHKTLKRFRKQGR
ncbi:hypothetical protein MJO28_015467, partial [Puccinia striiformis f. sp. tritici]